MAATANDIIKAAFGHLGVYQPEDSISAEDTTQALARLNNYLNSLNVKGAVFPTVSLTINANVPIGDENVEDLEWALAGRMAAQWGKMLQGEAAINARQGNNRFIAAHTKIYPSPADSGLGHMPSRWRGY